ncbi:ribonuclease H-like domain-containing protein [Gautieria morchelliformis]|nr:ribonuclease H-like domain-containing protein [Gautieria morchelliformis]
MARASTFGLRASRCAGGGGRYGSWRGSRGRGRSRGGPSSNQSGPARGDDGPRQKGWLVDMHPVEQSRSRFGRGGRAPVDYYFLKDDGGMFRCTLQYESYFHISSKAGLASFCRPNHLLRHRRLYLQLSFRNISDLLTVRRDILPLAQSNGKKMNARPCAGRSREMVRESRGALISTPLGQGMQKTRIIEGHSPYYLRVAIDNDIRVGWWYAVTFTAGLPSFTPLPYSIKRADPVVMAYDIETTKAPLKFPDQAVDQVMMISYMIDGKGFSSLILSEDIEDFEYTPKEGYEAPFTIFNEPDEVNPATILRFFERIGAAKPTVMATFNGDLFDFPFLCARAEARGIDMFLETGFTKDSEDEFKSRTYAHLDFFSQGLKAVTTAKLGYDPIELDPELTTLYAMEQPQVLAQYSLSDAVATYYLYMKYVHPFIFSLCNIIPLNPDGVLRKGSGTLRNSYGKPLPFIPSFVEAYRGEIIMPNRHEDLYGNMFEGHLLASETYVGGHVEALQAGVFRSDIPTHFKIEPGAVQKLIDQLDAALTFCISVESTMSLENVTNYDEVKLQIQSALEEMRDNPARTDKPLIYHLDVAAMYPNIMLSNRLQPDSVVDEPVCAVCDYNRPDKTCDRRMTWAWRESFSPHIETFPPKRPGDPKRRFTDLTDAEQTALVHKRLGDYSRKVYKKTKDTKVVNRESIICQRESPFYIDTVRRFRDGRYEYKGLLKTWKKNLDNLLGDGSSLAQVDGAKKLIVVYGSLQLAHKCILNSFYGYVMRKGARWHSMEMVGITGLTGTTIIQMARQLVAQIGQNFTFNVAKGKPVVFSYPCTMLNPSSTHNSLTTNTMTLTTENSIFFELDGPYKAMILPSSKEEDKLLKKR